MGRFHAEDSLKADIFDALAWAKYPECAEEIIARGFLVLYDSETRACARAYRIMREEA
jgi:hypothetical protein